MLRTSIDRSTMVRAGVDSAGKMFSMASPDCIRDTPHDLIHVTKVLDEGIGTNVSRRAPRSIQTSRSIPWLYGLPGPLMVYCAVRWAMNVVPATSDFINRRYSLAESRHVPSIDDGPNPEQVLGISAAWREVLKRAARVAAAEATTCLQGESGTGKEVVARFIHSRSPRRRGPFVAINCAALPEALLESELFG